MSKSPIGAWMCTECGTFEHVEREVQCWTCGKGEMVYVVTLQQAWNSLAFKRSDQPNGPCAESYKRAMQSARKTKQCDWCGETPCPYGDCDK